MALMGRGSWEKGGSKRSEYVRDGKGIRASERVEWSGGEMKMKKEKHEE